MPRTRETAFAIHAPPARIWALLRAEIEDGVAAGRAAVVCEEAPRLLTVDVRIGWGVAVRYLYRLGIIGDHTEVACEVSPHGFRFALGNILSLGRGTQAYRFAAAQGLANLKAAAEDASARM